MGIRNVTADWIPSRSVVMWTLWQRGRDNRGGRHEVLFPTFEAVGIAADQTGFLIALLSGLDVVGNSPIPDHLPIRIINDIAIAWVIVAGLPDAADIHQIA